MASSNPRADRLAKSLQPVDLSDLKAMLESNPVDRKAVELWFEMVY